MASILGNIVKGNTNINDEIIAGNMLASAKGAADAYLNATLISTTPELRAVYSSSLNQIVAGHSALTELAVNHGWDKPYNPPTQQLSETYKKSTTMVNPRD